MTTLSEYLQMEEPDPTEPDEFYHPRRWHSWDDPRFDRLRVRPVQDDEDCPDDGE